MATVISTGKRVALLRGVNVGGVKVLMGPLRDLARGLGWRDVETYIASGNLVFAARGEAAALAAQLRAALAAAIGVDTPILVLSAGELAGVLADHPWRPERGNQSHVFFCWTAPVIDTAAYQSLKAPEEELRVVGRHLHFLAPNGIGQSKLAEKLHRVVGGTEMTGRNLNTVRKLAEMTAG